MAIRKRFIAGAKCPACQAQDSMAMWRENNIDIVECVKCGHQMWTSHVDPYVVLQEDKKEEEENYFRDCANKS